MDNEIILSLKGIHKYFPGVHALADVDLDIRQGSVHAIVGENGAGKSTLMKVLSGMYKPSAGEIFFNGEKITIENERHALNLGISMIYQELNSILDMDVMENMFIGQEIKKFGLTDKRAMYKQTEAALKKLNILISPRTIMRSLSVANRQMIEIAKAVMRDAQIIVMDEPTSSISHREVNELFKLIKKLRAKGVSILYISHRLEEVPVIADEITIMRDGKKIHHCLVGEVSKDKMVSYMVGRELTNQFPKVPVKIGAPVLRVQNLTRYGVFKEINFEVKAGEILGFAGLVGAGRTEVMNAVFGLDGFDEGVVEINGKQLKFRHPAQAIKEGIAIITEDRHRFGLVTVRSIQENVMHVHIKDYINKFKLISSKKEIEAVNAQIKRFQIKTRSRNMAVSTLSGGNQQKVVLAKWMLVKPKVLIMDEPTRGIDVGAKYEIYKLMCELASEGIAIIMVSSELPEVLGMSDRILVMTNGQIKGELSREEATQEKIMKISAGGDVL